jgi:hypothetical protein
MPESTVPPVPVTTSCPLCGTTAPGGTLACPACGVRLPPVLAPAPPPSRRLPGWVGVLLALGLGLACLGGGLAAVVAGSSRPVPSNAGLLQPTSTPQPGGIFEASEVRNPYQAAPFGAPVRLRIGARELLLRVVEVRREAYLELVRLGVPVPAPEPSFDYLLVRLRIECVAGPVQPWTVPPVVQDVMAQGQTWGRPALPPPPPPFAGAVLAGPGTSHEGWLAPALIPRAGQEEALLALQLPGASGEVWFHLR